MLDTAERLANLSAEAKTIYKRLLVWWLDGEGFVWSRRDLHQRLKSGGRFPRAVDLDAPLAELVTAGLVRPWTLPAIGRYRSGPRYALIEPQHRRGRRPGRVPTPPAAPPAPTGPPVDKAAAMLAAAPLPVQDTDRPADPLGWRVEAMWQQIVAAGRIVPVMARPRVPSAPGRCRSCGDALADGTERHCRHCVRAMLAVADLWRRRSTGRC